MTRVSRSALVALLALSLPTIAAAQMSQDTAPPAASPGAAGSADTAAGAAPSAQDARTAGADASVAAGMPVKDNTGATIGKITAVKPGSSGEQLATVQMGTDTFAVGTDKLAVQGGAATINATQAEIKQMLKK
jgi:hypothetical protein